MSDDNSDGEIEELREQVRKQQDRIDDLEARYQAAMSKSGLVRDLVLGDLDAFEDQVKEAPALWVQVADLRTAMADHGDRLDRLDSAGARGQPGAARKAKIRHALVRKATNGGTVSVTQATQRESPAMDYEDVLTLFENGISDTYASKLLNKAAEGSRAFWVKRPSNPRDGRKTLRVDVAELDEDSPYLREARQNASPDSANMDFAELGKSEHSEGGGSE